MRTENEQARPKGLSPTTKQNIPHTRGVLLVNPWYWIFAKVKPASWLGQTFIAKENASLFLRP